MIKKQRILFLVSIILGSLSTFGAKPTYLTGAGASFPYQLYRQQFDVYTQDHNVTINYKAIGSGRGIKQLRQEEVDFAASDAFLSDELSKRIFKDKDILHIPICIGAVSLSYNIPGIETLNLDSKVLTQIYLGLITYWSDESIQAINPNITLPHIPIIPIRRSDSSGTTFIFSDFLSKTNSDWSYIMGSGQSLNWKIGIAGTGSEEVAQLIKDIPGSIGYVSNSFAEQAQLKKASIKNKSNQFIYPTSESISLAAEDTAVPDDTKEIITNTNNPEGYPISSLTWILIYKDQYTSEKEAKELKNLLQWMTGEGQTYTTPLLYAPLTPSLQEKANRIISSMTYKEKAL